MRVFKGFGEGGKEGGVVGEEGGRRRGKERNEHDRKSEGKHMVCMWFPMIETT